MDSPNGLALGLSQVGAGAMRGFVEGGQEARARVLQDRAYGLQHAQNVREQGLYDMKQADWERLRMAQDAELRASVLSPTMVPASLTSTFPDVTLPPGHPEAPPEVDSKQALGLAEVPAFSPGAVPSAGLTSSNPGVAREQVKGANRVETAIRTGKANALASPEAFLAHANASLAQANAANQQIHETFAASGLDANSTQGQLYLAALQRHLGGIRDAAYQQALQFRRQADEAKAMTYGQRASNYLLAGRVDQAAPYLQALGADPALFQGMKQVGNFYVLPGGARFTTDALEAMANPSVSQDERMKAMAHVTDAVLKEQEVQSRIREVSIRAASDHYDPVLAHAAEIERLDRAYQGLPPSDPQRPILANKVHNLRAMTGILAAESKTQTAAVGQWKAQAQAELAKGKQSASALIALYRDPLADSETKAEIRQNLLGLGVNPDAGGGAPAGLVPAPKTPVPTKNPRAAALY